MVVVAGDGVVGPADGLVQAAYDSHVLDEKRLVFYFECFSLSSFRIASEIALISGPTRFISF